MKEGFYIRDEIVPEYGSPEKQKQQDEERTKELLEFDAFLKRESIVGLKAFAILRDITQAELARAIGISPATMSRKVSGQSEITIGDLRRVWEVYGPLSEEEQKTLLSE